MARAYVLDEKGNQVTVAESDETVRIEGNHYFPPDSVNEEVFVDSDSHTVCHWKGEASYYTIVVDDLVNEDAAWYYPVPKEEAENIRGHVAFWKGVTIED